jgi:hypothetical protein
VMFVAVLVIIAQQTSWCLQQYLWSLCSSIVMFATVPAIISKHHDVCSGTCGHYVAEIRMVAGVSAVIM